VNKYSITVHWDEKNEEFIATSKEFPYLSGIGDSKEEAVNIIEEAISDSLEMMQEEQMEQPSPITIPEYSGNIRLRLPKSLHKQLAEMAELEGVSLNQYMVSLLSMNAGKINIHFHDHKHDHKHQYNNTTNVTISKPEYLQKESLCSTPDYKKINPYTQNRIAHLLNKEPQNVKK